MKRTIMALFFFLLILASFTGAAESGRAERERTVSNAVRHGKITLPRHRLPDVTEHNQRVLEEQAGKTDSAGQPTTENEKETRCDVPDVLAYLGDKLEAGQFAKEKSSEKFSDRVYFSYDNWSTSFVNTDPYFDELMSGKYPFTLVKDKVEDYSKVNGGFYYYYYFRYIGDKQVSPLRFDEAKPDVTYHMMIRTNVGRGDDHFVLSVYLAPGLTYAGDQNGTEADRQTEKKKTSGSDVVPSPTVAPKRLKDCSKCHGSGKIKCTNCDGKGFKTKIVSVPNYSGKGKTMSEKKENCFRCGGTGTVECDKCHGNKKVPY